MMVAGYLINKPTGAPLVYLIVAATLFAVAAVFAGYTRDVFRALVCAGLAAVVLALLTH